MKTGLPEAANRERSSEKADREFSSDADRNMILSWLREDIEWLRAKARNARPPKNKIRVSLIRASIYGCSVYLQALRDKELEDMKNDIALIKEKLGL